MAADYIYRNLKTGGFSVMNRGLVVDHGEHYVITPHASNDDEVRFVVRQSGRERVLHEGRKNVHAFVVGVAQYAVVTSYGSLDCLTVESLDKIMKTHGAPVRVMYRPTDGDRFHIVGSDTQVESAAAVYARASQAYRTTDLFAWGVK